MGLRILKPETISADVKERIIIYSRAGVGKTRLALSVTPRFGKIVYFAADDNSEFLPSVSDKKKKRIYTVVPDGDDIMNNFMSFCMTDWKKIDHEIGTLVVDTFTKVGQDSIRYSANTGSVTSEKHYTVGDPTKGGQVIPNRGDYLAIDSLGRGFLDMLADKQRDMHVILICHEDVKLVENVHAVGGPSYPGRQMIEYLPAAFSTVIRLVKDQVLKPGAQAPEDVVVAIGDNDGKFIAKMRTTDEDNPNPLGRVALDRDPSSYWVQYDGIYAPSTVEAVNG